jgi:hypothetical protein
MGAWSKHLTAELLHRSSINNVMQARILAAAGSGFVCAAQVQVKGTVPPSRVRVSVLQLLEHVRILALFRPL